MRLRDFLQHAPSLADQPAYFAQQRAAWSGSVGRLVKQLAEWLQRADPARRLRVTRTSFARSEPNIGEYTVPGLIVEYGPTEVHIVPLARSVAAPVGVRFPRTPPDGVAHITDGGRSFLLYRFATPKGDEWWLVDQDEFVPRFRHLTESVFAETMARFLATRD